VTIILSFFIDGTRPSRRAVLGGLLAVVGAIALKDAQSNWWLLSSFRKLVNI
jgi:drug/metabolite transporter (DMT)-like permease